MKPLEYATNSTSVHQCASLLIETVPLIMRRIRTEMRTQNLLGLSVPQLRALVYLSKHQGASLSDLADHFGVTSPTASKVVDVLVERKLASRLPSTTDRRYIKLTLTSKGQDLLKLARHVTEEQLAETLRSLSQRQIAIVTQGMETLRQALASDREAGEEGKQ